MENLNNHPLPPPRNGNTNKCMKIKPPVPLPRKNVNINNSVFKEQSSSTSSNFKDLKNNQIKQEIKMASENVLERKKSVVENTKSMSIYIEKSIRNLLPRPTKRHTTSQTSEDINLEINESPIENDIFSSLSFDSPIPSDSNSDRSFTNYYSEYDLYSPKPPNFPPPPLPEDVLYDKIPSSSNSSSQCGSYSTENMYEFISNGHMKPNTNSSYENWNLTSERSNSWSYPSNTSNINSEINYQKSNNFKSMDQTCFLKNEGTSDESKSAVVQFDPLHNSFNNLLQKQKEENCSLLQEIDEVLCTSYYSTIESTSDMNDNLENFNEDLYAIPEPPDRVDSIQESSNSIELHIEEENDLDCKEQIEVNNCVEEKPRRNSINSWSNMKHNLKKVAVGSTGSIRKIRSILKTEEKTVKDNVEEEHSNIFHDGILFVSSDEKNKDFEKKMCKLAGGLLKYSNSKTQLENSVSLTSLLSIQTVDEPKKR